MISRLTPSPVIGFLLFIITATLCLSLPASVMAQSIVLHSDSDEIQSVIPASLKPWQQWVLKDKPYLACPFINGQGYGNQEDHACVWASPLSLNLVGQNAQFSQTIEVLQKSFVDLPGGRYAWPQQVKANNKNISIIDRRGVPTIELNAGVYQISGTLVWQQTPSYVQLPAYTAVLKLSIDGNKIAYPRLQNQRVLLQAKQVTGSQADSLSVDVVRKINDGVYIQANTKIMLRVSGKSREVIIGKPLLIGFDLIAIESDLPSFLDADGLLRVQVKPGEWEVNVNAYASPDTTLWERPVISHIWPETEIWAIEQAPHLRSAKVEGVSLVDPEQTMLPAEWRRFASYLVESTSKLNFNITLRGKPLTNINRLQLARNYWLSFDHKHLTFVDTIKGSMVDNWRISMTAPYTLESAKDTDGPMLITQLQDNEAGVETRYANVNITAQGKIAENELALVSGWQNNFDEVSMNLNLPPGTLLFGVLGADRVSRSWLSNWGIWTNFIVLFSTIIAFRLFGPLIGILTGAVLVTIYQENYAPVMLMLNMLIAIAAKKHITFDKLQKLVHGYFMFSVVSAVIAVLFFSAMQIRSSLHPQLESSLGYIDASERYEQDGILRSRVSQPQVMQSNMDSAETELIKVSGMRKDRIKKIDKYQPDGLVQAGSGIPNWKWKSYYVYWDSPVTQAQTFSLMIWSKNEYRLFKLVGIILVLVWFYLLFKGPLNGLLTKMRADTDNIDDQSNNNISNVTGDNKKSTLVSICIGALLSFTLLAGNPQNAYAQSVNTQHHPSQQELENLRQWLSSPPMCAPNCATNNQALISLKDKQNAEVTLLVHANAATALALPRSDLWYVQKVTIGSPQNAQQNPAKLLQYQNWQYVWVPKGIHTIKVSAQIAASAQWQLRFKRPPKLTTIKADSAWSINGVNNGTLAGNVVEFILQDAALEARFAIKTTEQSTSQEPTDTITQYTSSPLVIVKRRITFAQNWRINTVVSRVAPAQGAINISVPLLKNEAVTSSNVEINDNAVNVSLGASVQSISWQSSLSQSANIRLQAPQNSNILEHWQLMASPTWHLNIEGVPATTVVGTASTSYHVHEYFAHPGEVLNASIERPASLKGDALAIDKAVLDVQHGNRTTNATLSFTYRSTQGAEHSINLPDNFTLKSVTSNGQLLNIEAKSDTTQGASVTSSVKTLLLPLLPGQNDVVISMTNEQSPSMITQQPKFNLNAPSSNIMVNIELTGQRWTLATSGPVIGPAVLYWGELLAFILIALVLSKKRFSPLSTTGWIILGLGLSLNNWAVLILVATWFASVWGSTYRNKNMSNGWYNLSQLVLYMLTFVTLLSLIAVIPNSLLSSPNMGIAGNAQYFGGLSWFADQSDGSMPDIYIFSLHMYVYKALMLVWVIWLSFALVNWVKWAWAKLGAQGYWKSDIKQVNNS